MSDDVKSPDVSRALDKIHVEHALGSMKRSEALQKNKCQMCGKDASSFNDDASKKEYLLTAWCQSCQDEYWNYEASASGVDE